jgi:GNAT superfamily N-acetyltransferase
MTETSFTIRNYCSVHYEEVKALMQACFADMGSIYSTYEELELLSSLYPHGQILFFANDELVAANFSRIVPFDKYKLRHTQVDCANLDSFLNDAINGDSVYGLDVIVKPDYQSSKIGKQIVKEFLDRVFSGNFKYMLGISRIVNYHKYADSMSALEYAEEVKARRINDPVLGFHFSYGCEIIGDSPDFNVMDVASAGEGIIIGVKNPEYIAVQTAKHVD